MHILDNVSVYKFLFCRILIKSLNIKHAKQVLEQIYIPLSPLSFLYLITHQSLELEMFFL